MMLEERLLALRTLSLVSHEVGTHTMLTRQDDLRPRQQLTRTGRLARSAV